MSKGFQFQLSAAVPTFEYATTLAEGLRLFDKEAFIHIMESNEGMTWDIVAMFNLKGGQPQFTMVHSLFTNAVTSCGGKNL